MRPRYLLLAALALALLGFAGCGGGGGETTSTPAVATTPSAPTPTKEELIAQGDAICAEVNAAVGTVASNADSAGRVSQEASLYSGMVERLKALGTPEDDAGYPEFISSAEELAQAASNALLAAERGDSAGLEAAESEVSSALASFQSAAQAYGFEDCGEGPHAPETSTGTPAPSESEGSGGLEEEGEAAPEEEAEATPETGGGAAPGGEPEAGGTEEPGGSSSGGIGPG